MLAAALDEFSEHGYHETSIEAIAARTGTTKGAVYYYFRDKEDLASDLQSRLWERLERQALAGVDPDASALDNLKGSFRAFLHALGDLDEARFFLRDCWAVPALDLRQKHEHGVALVRSLLARGVERGEIDALDPDAAAHVLMGAFAEAALRILTTGAVEPTAAVVERMIDALVSAPSGVR